MNSSVSASDFQVIICRINHTSFNALSVTIEGKRIGHVSSNPGRGGLPFTLFISCRTLYVENGYYYVYVLFVC